MNLQIISPNAEKHFTGMRKQISSTHMTNKDVREKFQMQASYLANKLHLVFK